jgi:hypothetical protein
VYGPRVGALRMARVPARGLVRERASWSQASRDPAPRAGTGPAKPKVTTGIEPVHGGFADRAVEQRDPAWKAGLASLGRGARHRCAPDSPAGRPSSRQRDAARASPRHRIDEGPRQRRDPLARHLVITISRILKVSSGVSRLVIAKSLAPCSSTAASSAGRSRMCRSRVTMAHPRAVTIGIHSLSGTRVDATGHGPR